MIAKSPKFDNLHDLHEFNNAAGDEKCDGRIDSRNYNGQYFYIIRPCYQKTQCFRCHIFGDGMVVNAERAIWRAMNNLHLFGVTLYFVTIRLVEPPQDHMETYSKLDKKWDSFRRTWSRHADGLEYVRVVSYGDNQFPHLHIIATSEPPEMTGLDIDCQIIGHTKKDRDNIARYMAYNLRQVNPFISKPLTKSNNFTAWSQSDIYHIARYRHGDKISRSQLRIHLQQGKRTNQSTIPRVKECTHCGNKLPETTTYFHRDGTRIRNECVLCWQYVNVATKANIRAKDYEVRYGLPEYALGRLSHGDVAEVVQASQVKLGTWRDYWTGDEIDTWCIDHRQPLSRGGMNTIDNLCLTHPDTNNAKSDMPLSKWYYTLAAHGIAHPDMPETIAVQKRLI